MRKNEDNGSGGGGEGRTGAPTRHVPYLQLFRYSTVTDKLLILMGAIVSVIAGMAIPLLNINFGHMIDIYIQFDELSDFHRDLLRRPRNYTTFQIGFEGLLVGTEVDAMSEIPIEVRDFSEKSHMIAFNILAIGFVYFVLCYFFTVILDKSAATIMYRTRLRFYESLLKHEVSWYDQSFVLAYSSDMEARFSLMEDGIGKKTGFFLYMLSASICSLLTAVYYGWELTFVLLALTPAFALLFAVLCRNQQRRELQAQHDRQLVNAVVREIVAMIRVIFSFGGEVKQIIRTDKVVRKSVRSEIAFKVLTSIGYAMVWFSNYVTYAAGVWYGSKLIIVARETEGSPDYTVGRIIIVFWNVLSITYFAGRTRSFLAAFEDAATAAGEIFHLIQRESCSHVSGIRPNQFSATIQFQKVSLNHAMQQEEDSSSNDDNNDGNMLSNSWTYTTRKCLKELSMHVPHGETVAVVGRPGSGKSLIPKLLTRIIEQQEGHIRLGGMEIQDLSLEWLRSNIGFVGKDPFIFDGTIHDNIWLGDRTSIRSDIFQAAKLANAFSFIQDLSPAGFDTVVGSKGRILSPGQMQRIAIAKALLKNPQILVLDQVTSNVPVHELDDVTIAIEQARIRRTTILVSDSITHSVQNADHILVIKNGQVVEEGSHGDLMARKGVYRQMFVQQAVTRMSASCKTDGDDEEDGSMDQQEEEKVIPYIDKDVGQERDKEDHVDKGQRREEEDEEEGGKEEDGAPAGKPIDLGNEDQEDGGGGQAHQEDDEKKVTILCEDGKEWSPKLMREEKQEPDSGDDDAAATAVTKDGVKLSAAKLDSSSTSTTSDSSSITAMAVGKDRRRSGACFTAFSHQYSVKTIAKFMQRDAAFLLMGCICSAVFGLGVPLYAVIVGEFMMVLESKDHDQILQETKLVAAAFIGLALLVSAASAASSIFFAVAASRLSQRLKCQAIRSFLSQSLEHVGGGADDETVARQRLTSVLCNDVEPLAEMVTGRAASYSQTAGTVIACTAYSLALNWRLGLIALTLMPFIIYRFKIMTGSSSGSISSSNSGSDVDKDLVSDCETTKTSKKLIHAVRTSSCLQHQIQFTPIFRRILLQDLQRKDGLLHMKGQALAVIQCIPVLAYGIVFLVGSHYIQEDMIHYADFFKIVEGVIFGSILVSEGALFAADFQDLKGRAGYLLQLIDSQKLPDSSGYGSIPDGCDGTVHFSHVDYHTGLSQSPAAASACQPELLRSFSMHVSRGQSIAIFGQQDGGSRQAITCLLQKLYRPAAGAVSLDGHDVSSLNTPWIRSKIAVLTSRPQLLSLSVGENIAFGDNNRYVSFAEVVEAAKAAGIHDFIQSLPRGYDTLTDSSILSAEHKLRLGIARAWLRNPVILIWDQIEAGLDEGTMNQLQTALHALKQGRTLISLPASMAWNASYDRILLIENATVREEGSHEDLMRRSGHYFDLYKLYE